MTTFNVGLLFMPACNVLAVSMLLLPSVSKYSCLVSNNNEAKKLTFPAAGLPAMVE
jgi:hypothetical protein